MRRQGAAAVLVLLAGLMAACLPVAEKSPWHAAEAQSASATPAVPAGGARPRLIVSGDQAYPPFEYLDENGEPAGFNVDLIRAVAEVEGYDVEIRLQPWDAARADLQEGRVDVLAGMVYTPERDRMYDFSIPHSAITFALFTQRKSDINSLADLQGHSVLVQEGGAMQDFLVENHTAARIVPVKTPLDALRRLAAGGADAALLNKMQALYFINEYRLNNLRVASDQVISMDYCFAVFEGNQSLRLKLDEGLQILKNNGEYRTIYNRWFQVYEQQATWDMMKYYILALLVAAALLGISISGVLILRRQVGRRSAALRESEKQYRLLYQRSPVGIFHFDTNLRLTDCNDRLAEIMKSERSRLVGLDLRRLKDTTVLPYLARILEREEVTFEGHYLATTSNAQLQVFVRGAPLYDAEGNLKGGVVIVEDVTERRQAEEKIRQQVQRLTALHEVDQAIGTSLDQKDVLNTVLKQARKQLNSDAAAILLLDPEGRAYHYIAGVGFRRHSPSKAEFPLGEKLAGQVAEQRKVVSIPNLMKTRRASQEIVTGEGFVAYHGAPLLANGQVIGVMEIFHRTPFIPNTEWLNFFETLAGQAAIAIDKATLFESLQRSKDELEEAYDVTLEGWARAMELRDRETVGHTRRVAELTVRLCRALGMGEEEVLQARRGALLHDIGKLAIPDSILFKTGGLDADEWEVMRRHPIYAYQLLSPIPYLGKALDIPYAHHEHWDGSGYPRGLKGREIPLAARAFAVVDVWDALWSDRPYRHGWEREQVCAHIQEGAGTHFDPHVVKVFFRMVARQGREKENRG